MQRQAQALAYLDLFRVFAVAMVAVIPLVLLMRRSVASGKAVAARGVQTTSKSGQTQTLVIVSAQLAEPDPKDGK